MGRIWEELSHRCIWDVSGSIDFATDELYNFTIDRWILKIWLPLAQVTNRTVK